MANLLWLQGGACSGTMSFRNAEELSAFGLVTDYRVHKKWCALPSLALPQAAVGVDLSGI